MLSIVGINSNPPLNFLARALAAALLALSPLAWAGRQRDASPAQHSVLIGLAVYMLGGSVIDLYAYLNDIVGVASVPSIAVRVAAAGVLIWLIPTRGERPAWRARPDDSNPRPAPLDARSWPHGVRCGHPELRLMKHGSAAER